MSKWIPTSDRIAPNEKDYGKLCPRCIVMTKCGVTEGWYNPDAGCWYIVVWTMYGAECEVEARYNVDFARGDKPVVVKANADSVKAWMPLPEPYEVAKGDSE